MNMNFTPLDHKGGCFAVVNHSLYSGHSGAAAAQAVEDRFGRLVSGWLTSVRGVNHTFPASAWHKPLRLLDAFPAKAGGPWRGKILPSQWSTDIDHVVSPGRGTCEVSLSNAGRATTSVVMRQWMEAADMELAIGVYGQAQGMYYFRFPDPRVIAALVYLQQPLAMQPCLTAADHAAVFPGIVPYIDDNIPRFPIRLLSPDAEVHHPNGRPLEPLMALYLDLHDWVHRVYSVPEPLEIGLRVLTRVAYEDFWTPLLRKPWMDIHKIEGMKTGGFSKTATGIARGSMDSDLVDVPQLLLGALVFQAIEGLYSSLYAREQQEFLTLLAEASDGLTGKLEYAFKPLIDGLERHVDALQRKGAPQPELLAAQRRLADNKQYLRLTVEHAEQVRDALRNGSILQHCVEVRTAGASDLLTPGMWV